MTRLPFYRYSCVLLGTPGVVPATALCHVVVHLGKVDQINGDSACHSPSVLQNGIQYSCSRCEKIKLSPEQDQGLFGPVKRTPEVSRRSLSRAEGSRESYFRLQSRSDRLDTPASTVDLLSYAYLVLLVGN